DALAAYGADVETRICFTGQHASLVDQVMTAFSMERHYELALMKEGQSVYDVVQGGLFGVPEVIRDFRPDVVLVQGDTATVFAAALAGFFEGVKVGHVEAGLRSGDLRAPFPEEGLRRMTDAVSSFHFAPTRRAAERLTAEGVPASAISLTGNTVVDALQRVSELNRPFTSGTLREMVVNQRRLVLLTAHRRESFGEPLRDLFGAVRTLADEREDISVVYPVHPNPEVRVPAWELLAGHPRVHLVDPLDYFDLVGALRAAELVMTDSGGIQEEAPTFGSHVLVLRSVTERPEGIDAGVAELVGTDPGLILERAHAALDDRPDHSGINPYGDGHAGRRIADILVSHLTGRPRETDDWAGPQA
ncbi:MAG: UDP-N-acetylglucosamine 2-epimerase (non-hydrolyzing), partial [Gemmatimonadota bacterium]